MSDPLLRRSQVEAEIGLTRSSIYRLMDLPPEDPLHLPRPKRVGRSGVRWPASTIEAWKARRETAERRT